MAESESLPPQNQTRERSPEQTHAETAENAAIVENAAIAEATAHPIKRRSALLAIPATLGLQGCSKRASTGATEQAKSPKADPILETFSLGTPGRAFMWRTFDPFLFCVHHLDNYPAGNEAMGPQASLRGRNLGSDFGGKNGWNMYHGNVVPGFPRHPHRGFETVTVTRRGYIDHSDSLGLAARYGQGDVQWMTAGQGIVHAEMFPLLDQDNDNPAELFQIWLNLPKADKFAKPYFSMFWKEKIPTVDFKDQNGKLTQVTLTAGELNGKAPPSPPPKSWGARTEAHLAIWTVKLSAGATWTLPAVAPGVDRTLYYFSGKRLELGKRTLPPGTGIRLQEKLPVTLKNGEVESELLLLQGKPIAEPIVKRGPFVMNSPEEIKQAYIDYQRTQYGGWPWPNTAPVHAREEGRFAIHADGRKERAS